jgi:ABC-2 type transport system ATP-binding protein
VSFQGNALWEKMNVQKNLDFFRELNNIDEKALLQLVKYFEFDFYLKKRVDELSSGNKRKLCIIISLMINPNLLLFDEATCGVDLMIRLKLKKVFEHIKLKNEAIGIFTTHFLKDIDIFCDKLGIIENGQFLCVDYIENIKKNLGGYLLKFQSLDLDHLNGLKEILGGMGTC